MFFLISFNWHFVFITLEDLHDRRFVIYSIKNEYAFMISLYLFKKSYVAKNVNTSNSLQIIFADFFL